MENNNNVVASKSNSNLEIPATLNTNTKAKSLLASDALHWFLVEKPIYPRIELIRSLAGNDIVKFTKYYTKFKELELAENLSYVVTDVLVDPTHLTFEWEWAPEKGVAEYSATFRDEPVTLIKGYSYPPYDDINMVYFETKYGKYITGFISRLETGPIHKEPHIGETFLKRFLTMHTLLRNSLMINAVGDQIWFFMSVDNWDSVKANDKEGYIESVDID